MILCENRMARLDGRFGTRTTGAVFSRPIAAGCDGSNTAQRSRVPGKTLARGLAPAAADRVFDGQ
jgi:hypothetical protein